MDADEPTGGLRRDVPPPRGTVVGEFLRVITPDELVALLAALPRPEPVATTVDDAVGRVLAADLLAPEALPDGARATMDGYAVRAADTFGASDALPALLSVVGAVEMGALPAFAIGAGQAAAIPTGGYLPAGADAVVMVEEVTPAAAGTIEVHQPVTAGESVLGRGEDVAQGALVLAAGAVVRPHDVALAAALGVRAVTAWRPPRVALLSTGDEIVPLEATTRPGQVRDSNAHGLRALLRSLGAEPLPLGIVRDERAGLERALREALECADVVALSGGSSVGQRDLAVEVVASLPGAEVLAHGVAVSPGKPTLLARCGGRAIVGLPGHPVSALVVAHVFLAPFVRYLAGAAMRKGPLGQRVTATLASPLASQHGREEYVRVRLDHSADPPLAVPVLGRSSMLSTLGRADGLLAVPLHAEGLPRGSAVEVTLLRPVE
jgi:molybdopterin molybdotransferase